MDDYFCFKDINEKGNTEHVWRCEGEKRLIVTPQVYEPTVT